MAHLKTFVCFDVVSEDGSWNRKGYHLDRYSGDLLAQLAVNYDSFQYALAIFGSHGILDSPYGNHIQDWLAANSLGNKMVFFSL